MQSDVWQAYDCPESGLDFDLHEGSLVFWGQPIDCSGCGKAHIAGTDVEIETCTEEVDASGNLEREFHDLPRTAEALEKIKKGGSD